LVVVSGFTVTERPYGSLISYGSEGCARSIILAPVVDLQSDDPVWAGAVRRLLDPQPSAAGRGRLSWIRVFWRSRRGLAEFQACLALWSNGQDLPVARPMHPQEIELEEGMAASVSGRLARDGQVEPADEVTFGAFHFAGHVPIGEIAEFYGLPVPHAEKATPVGKLHRDWAHRACCPRCEWRPDHPRRP
jgi:hypothetical protein